MQIHSSSGNTEDLSAQCRIYCSFEIDMRVKCKKLTE